MQLIGVVQRKLAMQGLPAPEPFAEMVRFRNRIVHGYADINPEMVYTIVTTRQRDFRRFRDAIDRL